MEDAQILRSIGALEESVRNLAQLAVRMDDKALEERQAIYDKVDKIKDEVDSLVTKVEINTLKLNSLIPVVDKIEEKYQQAVGAQHMGKIVWTAIISVVGLLGTGIWQLAKYLASHPGIVN